MKCSKCGNQNPDNVKFCSKCGEALIKSADKKKFCTKCGAENDPEDAFCLQCGGELSTKSGKAVGKKSKLPLIIAIILVIVIAVLAAVMLLPNLLDLSDRDERESLEEEEYRLIKLEKLQGEITLERDGDDEDAFEGMQLITEDTVTTGINGFVELLVDSDKHIGADADTSFMIEATGDEKEGKVTIELLYGQALFTIDNKLTEGSTFDVNTPNATLSVRGTTFHVNYDQESETTKVEVEEGTVWISSNGQEDILEAGESATISNTDISVGCSEDLFNSVRSKCEKANSTFDELEIMYYENVSNYGDPLVNEEIVNALAEYRAKVDEYYLTKQRGMTDEQAQAMIDDIDVMTGDAGTYMFNINELVAAQVPQWKDAYKEILASPKDWLKANGGKTGISDGYSLSDDYNLLKDFNNEAPILILSSYSNGYRGCGHAFISFDMERGAYIVAEGSFEINQSIGYYEGQLACSSIENGPGTYTINAITLDGSVKYGSKLASGRITRDIWPAGSEMESDAYKLSNTSPIDSY